jgi:aryl-alcohol dehydrogenase-like predicted oxidoreductase/enamine deaminase RidA (YjgF/YER057c/UK114 family)
MIPERTMLAPGLEISRIVTGLWQVADMERGRRELDLDSAGRALVEYADAGFDTFDMADHYGSAELIAGRCRDLIAKRGGGQKIGKLAVFTKWCPTPGDMTREVVRAGVQRSMDRLGVSKIDLLQFHWWTFEHPGYLDALRELQTLRSEGLIGYLGVTNFDTDHLRVLAGQGIEIATNQVCFSLLDRRAAEEMSAYCLDNHIKLLAYGTLAGGFFGDKWVGAADQTASDIVDWSKLKYRRFIDAIGGWDILQAILGTLAEVANKHDVSVANVATRWVLEQPAVGAIIVGARLGEREHRGDNLRVFAFSLDDEDRTAIDAAVADSSRIPGDCGDEYRRPPFLTASGDLSHHLDSLPNIYAAIPIEGRPNRQRIDSGSVWEAACGFSRAVRDGDRILVSGTTATDDCGKVVCKGDAAAQTVFILDKIAACLSALGGSLEDIVRTRIYLRDTKHWEAVGRVHGHYFESIRPTNTLIEVADLVGGYEVEIEAEAWVGR